MICGWRPSRSGVRLLRQNLMLDVWDESEDLPMARTADGLDEGGRGLLLVECLASSWGCYRTGYGGKVVWAMMDVAVTISR